MSKTNRVGHCREGSSDKVYIVSIVKAPSGYSVIGKGSRIFKSMNVYPKGSYHSLSNAIEAADKLWREKTTRNKGRYVNIENSDYSGSLTMTDPWVMRNLEDDIPELDPVPVVTTAPSLRTMSDEDLKEKVAELLKQGKRLGSIKVVRTETGWGLRQAKAFVNEIDQDLQKEKNKAESKERKAKREEEESRDFEVVCINATGMEDSFDEGITYVAEKHSDPDMIWVWDRNAKKRECFVERFEKFHGTLNKVSDMRFAPSGGKVKIIGEPPQFYKHYVYLGD